MSRRTSALHPWADHPELLTSIRSPWEKYRKVDWNFGRYEDAVFARPCDSKDMMYTAIDFCIAIVALRDWTRKALAREVRKKHRPLPSGMASMEDFTTFVAARVRWQAAIEAIANTTKHAEYRDDGWPKGIAMPASFYPPSLETEHEGCTDGFKLLSFMRRHSNLTWWDIALRQHSVKESTPGHEAFGDALDAWQLILTELFQGEV